MDLKQITQFLDSLQEQGIPSVDCIITQGHKELYRHMNGTTDEQHNKRINGSELYLMFSATKLQTMTAILQLVEQGRLNLNDSVAKYLPAYKELTVKTDEKIMPLEKELKIWHLLSMQSGLDYNLERPGILEVLKTKGTKATTREIVDAFAKDPLKFVPGEHYEYSLSHDVAAAIVEVVSGMSYGEYLKKNIWQPLHMEDTFFAKPMNHIPRLATQFVYDEQQHGSVPMEPACMYQLSDVYESGGAGLISCTKDYAKFADTLACGGVSVEGKRILKEETVELMRTNLLCDASRQDFWNSMGRTGHDYGCGVQIWNPSSQQKTVAPAGIFGWDGAAGACIIMNPKDQISLVYIQHVRNCGFAYSFIHPKLRELLYS